MQSEAEAMLLDRYLPRYDVTETHAVIIDADTDLTWQAVRRSDLSRSAVIRVLLEMRSLPNRLQRVLKRRPPGPARPPLTLDDMQRAGFVLLGESPGHEIVFGTVVQPWKAVTDDEPAPQVEAGRFAAFDTPGYVKVAFNIRVEPRRLGSRTTSSMMETSGALTFAAEGEGTVMGWDWQVHPKGWTRMLGPLFGPVGGRMERRIWTELKHQLETNGPARSA